MVEVQFTVRLMSDAELGSGLGGEIVNDLVPRDHDGLPVLRASHLKGLLRQVITDMAIALKWDRKRVLDGVFGRPGTDGDDGEASVIALTDARLEAQHLATSVFTISRTRIDEHTGRADDGSLRTVEAVKAGARFRGQARVTGPDESFAELVLRLALLSLPSVGAGRTRGAGSCVVSIDHAKDDDLARLLDKVDELLKQGRQTKETKPGHPRVWACSSPLVWKRILFEATTPVCCPERPVTGNNVLKSGWSIPASAVQGALLTRASEVDPALGDALFKSDRFRCWPLHPFARDSSQEVPELVVRVSRTHRISKLPIELDEGGREVYRFADTMIEPYDWAKVASGSPLKGADGVLLAGKGNESVRLWSSAQMPREVSAHGVHNDPTGEASRNLFTVVSMAPMRFMGFMAMPKEEWEALEGPFKHRPMVEIGKARSIRGQGVLRFETVDPALFARELGAYQAGQVFVLQSPVLIPDDADATDLREVVAGLIPKQLGKVAEVEASAGVRFGWNRHGLGDRVGQANRLRACRVLLPGTVFRLEKPVADLEAFLLRGLGDGRERGFGSLLPHPGVAKSRVSYGPKLPVRKTTSRAPQWALQLFKEARNGGPSPSQIGRFMALAADRGRAREYLNQQLSRTRQKQRWQPVKDKLLEILDEKEVIEALRIWQDITIAQRGGEDTPS